METLHQRYGRLPWGTLFAARDRARRDRLPHLASAWPPPSSTAQAHGLDDFPAARNLYFHQDGSPKAEGETFTNPDLARTFRLIAAEGSEPFYEGAIARDIVAAVRTETNPGILTLDDLAAYEVKERAAGLPALPRLRGLRHGPAELRRADRRPDARHPLALRPAAPWAPACRRRISSSRPASSPSPTAASTWPTATSSTCPRACSTPPTSPPAPR